MFGRIIDWFGFGDAVHTAGAHGHEHDFGEHGHTHGVIDPTIATTQRGIWAIKWSFIIMAITAAIQVAVRTTAGAIALSNLEAEIDGLERRAAGGDLASQPWARLVDLVMLRAQIVGRIADYEYASILAERRAGEAPEDALAVLSRSRTRGSLHRFAEAVADLDVARGLGLSGRELDAARAGMLQAVGRYDEAMSIRRGAEVTPDFESAAGLASLYADLGDIEAAEQWFSESYQRYRSVSPFAVAQLEFQRGHMWLGKGDLERAHDWFLAAWRRVPAFAQAEGHLAEVEHALGLREAPIARLLRLAGGADDPDYAGELASMLQGAGRDGEAAYWRALAEKRYENLIARHPAAFADHAARFWLSIGDAPEKAVGLARLNLAVRDTPAARSLLQDALMAGKELLV
jgi:tetratricopeptide (TPR) repeat protein